ncbi:hypothetical protein L195_g006382 [Trifolium pratense]|uniref:Uncharacterized protein n=1 Tax=Trifolium pratense TaxID=57577 RepID=A0A2K3P3F5_TRIPR|nr:hypothetical protein L195_g006382 [Trifolium pratense]
MHEILDSILIMFIDGLGLALTAIYTPLMQRSQIDSTPFLKLLLHTLNNLSVEAPATTKLPSHSSERKRGTTGQRLTPIK